MSFTILKKGTQAMLRNWIKRVFQTKSTSRPRARPSVEALEDRTTPSILFTPTQGQEHVTSGGGPVLGASNYTPIHLVFWGPDWNTSNGRAYANLIQSSINPMFLNSPYLNGLHQYGVQYHAYLAGSIIDPAKPPGNFMVTDAAAAASFGGWTDDGINLAITWPGATSDQADASGYHDYIPPAAHLPGLNFGWISTDGSLDDVTRRISHEVVETMTDPHLDGWRDYTLPSNDNEISDQEARGYRSLVNGYLVQSYWSKNDGAFIVDNGGSQVFSVNVDPYSTLTPPKLQLVVNGDQFGDGYGDTISVDVNAAGGAVVSLNGESVSFEPGQLDAITVNTGGGSNSVYVHNEAQGVDLTINDGGNDYVYIGSNGSVQGVQGAVQINSPYNRADLVIDDSADTTAQTAYIDDHSVTGLAPGNIGFNSDGLSYLTIYGGSGGNTFFVHGTPSTYAGSYAGRTYIYSGTGVDTVYVDGTAGGPNAGGLYIDGEDGHDYVYVGTDTSVPNPTPGTGTLANIQGFVYAVNSSGVTTLIVDDAADTAGHSATLNGNSLTDLAPAPIYWVPTSSSYTGGVDELHIYGSAAASAYYVTDSPNMAFGADLRTGAGADSVFITGTSGSFTTLNRGGHDNVFVGDGTVAGINGSVVVSGAGSTNLAIMDYLDTTAHSATLTGNSLMGLSTGVIWWTPSSSATGGVTYLKILDGAGNSTYTVTDTPGLFYSTDLNTGSGNDVIFITGTTGSLNVNNPDGYDRVYVGNGTLAGINSSVNVSGNGSVYLSIEDYLDTTSHTATVTATSLTGLSRGAIQWVPSVAATGGVTFLDIVGSAAGSTYNVTDTPSFYYYTDLETGAGSDSVYITGTTGALYLYNNGGVDTVVIGRQAPATTGGKVAAIKGFVDVYGAGTVALTVDDSGDTNGRGATLTSYSITGLAPAEIDYGTNLTSLTINGGIGNDTLTVASTSPSTSETFNGGGGSNTLVGPNTTNTWNITGTYAGNVNSTVSFSGVLQIVGGTGVDTFAFGPAGRVVSINGGGAPAGQGDWLDYTAATTAVSANLATGKVSDVTGTASGIQNVFGGNHGSTLTGNAQGNILIGGDGIDTIIGGSGPSLLIGGKGNDKIIGGAGDDIVIGGYTTYDQARNEAALMDIFARWQSADSYATRVSNLRTGWRPLALGTTVLDDGGADRLTGGAGLDWFFAGTHSTVTDLQGGEAVN
jgi:Ca2+-binding RTX toxin-like protein